ncbi:MAG: hypothetical protein ACI4D2_00770 [Lachnospiraceae bacterium]
MRVQAIPIFKDIHLLRKSMLEALSDHTFLASQFLYKHYGDGIMAGCELTTTENAIILNEGLIFFEGQMFLIKEPMSINYYPTNTTTVLKVHFSEQMQDGNFTYREIQLMLTAQAEIQKGEIELCRFKLQEGARLRYEYQDFEDRDTEFDTLNTIYAPHSAKGGSTLSPAILQHFAKEMLKEEELSELDQCICLQLMGQDRPINKDMLVAYLQLSAKRKPEDTSNHAVYRGLLQILKEVKGEGKGKKEDVGRKKWRMMVE